MQYRIKVIEYESGRKEYVPQVRTGELSDWKDIDSGWNYEEYAQQSILLHKNENSDKQIKSVTYKPVQP